MVILMLTVFFTICFPARLYPYFETGVRVVLTLVSSSR